MFLRDLILKDIWLKLFSLALAVLIWFTVSVAIRNENALNSGLVPQPPRTFSLRVNLLSATADVHTYRANPEFVEVTVRGEAGSPQELQPRDIHVLADVTGLDALRNSRRRLEISAPPGVEIIRVIPADVEIIVPSSPAK